MTMLILTFIWTLKMALNTSETTKFGFPCKLGYQHVYCPGITRIEDKLFLACDHGVPDDEVVLPPGDDV